MSLALVMGSGRPVEEMRSVHSSSASPLSPVVAHYE